MRGACLLSAVLTLFAAICAADQYEVCYCLQQDDETPNNRLTNDYCEKIQRATRDADNFVSERLREIGTTGYRSEDVWREQSGGWFRNGPIDPKWGHRSGKLLMDWTSENTTVCVRKDTADRYWMVSRMLFIKFGMCGPPKEYPDWEEQVQCAIFQPQEFYNKLPRPV